MQSEKQNAIIFDSADIDENPFHNIEFCQCHLPLLGSTTPNSNADKCWMWLIYSLDINVKSAALVAFDEFIVWAQNGKEVCDEHAFCAELRAMLLIAQKLRYVRGERPQYEKPPQSQKDVLRRQAKIIKDGIAVCGLEEPSEHDVREALERYRVFSQEEICKMLAAR